MKLLSPRSGVSHNNFMINGAIVRDRPRISGSTDRSVGGFWVGCGYTPLSV
jgi:hypothetical protein